MSVYSVRVILHRFFTFCKKMRAVVITRGFRVHSLRNTSVRNVSFDPKKVKVISLDVTGTILLHKTDVVESYAECLKWSHIAIPHTDELRKPFKDAYRAALTKYPCFGHAANMSGRDWWKLMLEDFLLQAKIKATHHQFERFFRRVYQHYGSLKGYETLPDAVELLTWIASVNDTPGMRSYSTGIISNTPTRTVDTVLPLLDLHNHFDWFLCCREIGVEKPNVGIYDEAHRRAEHYVPGLLRYAAFLFLLVFVLPYIAGCICRK